MHEMNTELRRFDYPSVRPHVSCPKLLG